MAAGRTTPDAESALSRGRDEVGGPRLVVCPETRRLRRRQDEGTRRTSPGRSSQGCPRVTQVAIATWPQCFILCGADIPYGESDSVSG